MMDLGELPFGRYEFAVWAGGHVTAGQHAGKDVRRGSELKAQDVGKSAFFGFDDGVGARRNLGPTPCGPVLRSGNRNGWLGSAGRGCTGYLTWCYQAQ